MCKLCFVIFMMGVLAASSIAAEIDLSETPRYLAYEATEDLKFTTAAGESKYMGDTVALMDVDGDGWPELIKSVNNYFTAQAYSDESQVLYYQINIPPRFVPKVKEHAGAALTTCPDLNEDGQDELVAWGANADRSEWFFWVVNPSTGDIQTEFFLPGGQDFRPDGIWDGTYFVAGTVKVNVANTDIQALIIGCTVGYDRYGRGMMAVNPSNGDILWRYDIAPNPLRLNVQLTDLDADGRKEIIFIGRSPDNLDGELINGISDDETHLFVLNSAGKLLWSRFLGEAFGNGELALSDMDGDGLPEIITCARTTPKPWGEVVIWNRAGQEMTRLTDQTQLRNVRVIQREDRNHPSLLLANSKNQILEYGFNGQELVLRHTVTFNSLPYINLVEDLLPTKGIETVVSSQHGPVYILDRELEPLSTTNRNPGAWHDDIVAWRPNQTTLRLLSACYRTPMLALNKAPFAWHRLLPYASAIGVILFLLIIWRIMHRPRQLDPHLVRETRLNLLENMELSNHGAIAPLKCVRRLVWHLRALQTNLGDNSKIEIRMRETWSECHDSALPHLKGILDRSQLAGLASDNISIVAAAATEIEKQLEILSQNNFKDATKPDLAERLEIAERQADTALIRLRSEIAVDFHADIIQVMNRVRAANSRAIDQYEIEFHLGQVANVAGSAHPVVQAPPPIVGLCDPRELEFVLDNLVGNAITAMKNSSTKQLITNWKTADGMVIIDITDTGCGLPHKDWDRALNTRYSTKQTGGEGLPNSRKYLRKYGGNLTILNSTPQKGTTFRVIIPEN